MTADSGDNRGEHAGLDHERPVEILARRERPDVFLGREPADHIDERIGLRLRHAAREQSLDGAARVEWGESAGLACRVLPWRT